MNRYRPTRVGELLQAEIARLLLRQLKDPRLNMATISRVEVSSDLRHACIYVSRLGSEAEQQAAIQGFEHAAGFIRSQLGSHLALRYLPNSPSNWIPLSTVSESPACSMISYQPLL
jgi:ribosome-binding factor A